MVTKKKSTGEKEAKRGRVMVGKLKLNKETVMDLSPGEKKRIKGGLDKTKPFNLCYMDVRTMGCQVLIPTVH